MGLKEYKEALMRLSEEGPWRSETAHLKHLLEEVEAALAVGVKRELVLEVLHKQGFKFSMRGFETALYRLRKRKKAALSPQAKSLEQLSTAASKTVQPTQKAPVATPSASGPQEKSPLNIPGYKSRVTDKDREEYNALKEAIKDLPDREQRKRMEQFWMQR